MCGKENGGRGYAGMCVCVCEGGAVDKRDICRLGLVVPCKMCTGVGKGVGVRENGG